jgi:hypothetical protein
VAKEDIITADLLRSIVHYDPETGQFVWKERTPSLFTASARRSAEHVCANWNALRAGKMAGTLHPDGHVIIRIFRINYKAHRLAWLYMTGAWPGEEIDHRNKIGSDNRFDNLREATHPQNMANKGAQANNSSGHKGVDLHKLTGKWRARIMVEGRYMHLGLFSSKADAAAAYERAAHEHCGEFARVS